MRENPNSQQDVLDWVGDLIREAGHQKHEMGEFGNDAQKLLDGLWKIMGSQGFTVRGGNGNIFCMKLKSGRWTVTQFRPLASRTVQPVFI